MVPIIKTMTVNKDIFYHRILGTQHSHWCKSLGPLKNILFCSLATTTNSPGKEGYPLRFCRSISSAQRYNAGDNTFTMCIWGTDPHICGSCLFLDSKQVYLMSI